MKRVVYVTLLAVLVVACDSSVPEAPPRAPSNEGYKSIIRVLRESSVESRIRLAAEGSTTQHRGIITFTLQNASAAPIKLYPSWLPWGNPNSIEVAAIDHRGRFLRTSWPIADPGPELPRAIAPGETLRGDFELQSRIEDLESALNGGDVLVMWAYRLPSPDQKDRRVSSGVLVLPKRPAV